MHDNNCMPPISTNSTSNALVFIIPTYLPKTFLLTFHQQLLIYKTTIKTTTNHSIKNICLVLRLFSLSLSLSLSLSSLYPLTRAPYQIRIQIHSRFRSSGEAGTELNPNRSFPKYEATSIIILSILVSHIYIIYIYIYICMTACVYISTTLINIKL